jgi:hypothetical protein
MKTLFKKLTKLILILFTISQVSCSTDETDQTKNETSKEVISNEFHFRTSPGVKEIAKDIYYDLDFKNYLSKNIEHIKKVNFVANKNEIAILKDELELDNWVKNNINKTAFNNLYEYETSKTDLKSLKDVFLNKFSNRLEAFRNSTTFESEFQEELNLITIEENKYDDLLVTEGCADAAIRCIRRARSNAATGLALSAVSAWFNPIVGAAGALGSQIYLSNALEACQDAFDACMGN